MTSQQEPARVRAGQAAVSYALYRPVGLSLESFARVTGTHPELVRRLVALGLLEAATDPAGRLWFAPAQLTEMARIQRLRAGFSLNYAAVGLVVDLLDRIAALEAAARSTTRRTGGNPWTRTG